MRIMLLIQQALDEARKLEEQGKTFIYNHTNREKLDT
jgi:glutamyl-tRNA synthetase